MAYRIMLDAGHGGDDLGAVYKDHTEKDDNLRLTMELGRILEDNGIEVILTRTTDTFETPFERAQTANNSDVDYLVSIHRNDSPLPNQYSGVSALVFDTSGTKYDMAENINASLNDLGFENLGVHERPGLVILRRTSMPTVLLEVGFINNDYDNDLFDSSLEDIAQAIANGILDTLNPSSARDVSGSTFSYDDWDEEYEEPSDTDDGNLRGSMQGTPVPSQPTYAAQPTNSSQPTNAYQPTNSSQPTNAYQPTNASQPTNAYQPTNASQPTSIPSGQAEDSDSQLYRVQVGLFSQRANADRLSYELLEKGYPTFILNEDGYFKVQVGGYRHLGNAIIMEQRLRKEGYATLITT